MIKKIAFFSIGLLFAATAWAGRTSTGGSDRSQAQNQEVAFYVTTVNGQTVICGQLFPQFCEVVEITTDAGKIQIQPANEQSQLASMPLNECLRLRIPIEQCGSLSR